MLSFTAVTPSIPLQFINTTNNTKNNKIKIGQGIEGVTAVKDNIYVGGNGKVIILNTDGSRVREITIDDLDNYFIKYKNASFTTIN
jgi:hypothetical protein